MSDSPDSTNEVVWAIKGASRYVPKATCLVQALAARSLLEKRGLSVRLCIGVARNQRGQFEAHAWLEQHGRVLLGTAEEANRFVPLPLLMRRH